MPRIFKVQWWLWNGTTFELHDLDVQPVSIIKCGNYRFFKVKNPMCFHKPGQEWLIAEGGTGYILAYGPDENAVLKAAKGRFQLDGGSISQVDVSQYIQGHLNLLKQYVGNRPGFRLPRPDKNILPVPQLDTVLNLQCFEV